MRRLKEEAKRDKKAAKANVKLAKKLARSGAAVVSGQDSGGVSPTPAERSAAAAETQVALHRVRVILSLAAVLVALATLLYTIKPWRLFVEKSAPALSGEGLEAETAPARPAE